MFPTRMNAWLKDHLALRSQFLAQYIRIWQIYLGSPNGRNYMGRNGEMFINLEWSNYKTHWGLIELSRDHLIKVKLSYAGMAGYFRIHNIPYYVIIIPDKHTLYPRKKPFYASWTTGQNYYNKLIQILRESHINYIDMLNILCKYKHTKLYDKTFDVEHWNANALNIAYKTIVGFLNADGIFQIPKNKIDNFFRIENINCEYNTYPIENIPFIRMTPSESIFDQTNKYRYMNFKTYPWEHPSSVIVNNKINTGTLCFNTDSYFAATHKLPLKGFKLSFTPLAYLVHKYIHFHYYYATIPLYDKIIADHSPDVVIEAFSERVKGNIRRTEDPRLRIFAECELKTPGYFLTPQALSHASLTWCTLRPQGENVELEAHNNDPSMVLPPVTTDADGRAMIAARISAPQQTWAQLFYAAPDEPFSEQKSTSVKLNKGENLVHLHILTQPHQRVKLRFDPATDKGTYLFLPLPWVNKLMGGQYGL